MSRKKITWRDRAKADLKKIDRLYAMDILHAIDRFSATGKGDVKRLTDIDPAENRLRIGDYRVRFHDLGDAIMILAINHRKEAYRD